MSPRANRSLDQLSPPVKTLIFAGFFLLSSLAAWDLFAPGWGSGHWFGRLSEKWVLLLSAVYLPMIGLLIFTFINLFYPRRAAKLWKQLLVFRRDLGFWRWLIFVFASLFPAWFVFYSPWGGLFTGIFIRFLIFVFSLLIVGFLLTEEEDTRVTWVSLLLAGLITGVLLVLAESVVLVSDYPFALHWSEGNRLWDYSVVFGRDLYSYSGADPIFAWIDPGRQTLWGLPFLISQIPIWAVRLWGAILVTVPYAGFGWVAFRPAQGAKELWMAAGLWTLIFLNQGPVYTPLVLAAILVALARKKPIWLALPLIYFAGHYAGLSRFTWRFAPGIWAVIMTFGDAVLAQGKLLWRDWIKATTLGLAGIWSKGLPIITGIVIGLLPSANSGAPPPVNPLGGSVETLQGLQASLTNQPFLLERLLPNPVYAPGILLGITFAAAPLIFLLIYLNRKGVWKTVFWLRLVMIFGLGSLFVVGVIASAKVGGGTDLHNMDMFFVGLVLVATLTWEGGFAVQFSKLMKESIPRWFLVGIVFIPAVSPLFSGKPLEVPSAERTEFILTRIQNTVNCARQYGEVLFMDQRQLITFGYMGDLPLIADYEKKYVMDQALTGNEAYFEKFRNDLASGRFSLIVSEREAILYKEPDIESIGDSLNAENNAWVSWVTSPLLQYYESVADFKDAAVELFMPMDRNYDCP